MSKDKGKDKDNKCKDKDKDKDNREKDRDKGKDSKHKLRDKDKCKGNQNLRKIKQHQGIKTKKNNK